MHVFVDLNIANIILVPDEIMKILIVRSDLTISFQKCALQKCKIYSHSRSQKLELQ